jgi:hypothetical protein
MQLDNKIYKAVIRTLSYSDVFDYPLQKKEIWKFLNLRSKINKKDFQKSLNNMTEEGYIEKRRGYYFLAGRKKILSIRHSRRRISSCKLKIARKASKILSFIPTVKLIAVSGSLSLKNARASDDIDFFIITSSNTLWITRFLVNTLLLLTGSKRSVKDFHGTNLICPNLFITQDSLRLSCERQNLFSAREISQLLVLFERNNIYEKFISANPWIKKYLPNVHVKSKKYMAINNENKLLNLVDKIFYAFQFLYMSNRITGEEVKQKAAYFHPKDKGKIILQLYKARYKAYCGHLGFRTASSRDTLGALDTPDASDTFN